MSDRLDGLKLVSACMHTEGRDAACDDIEWAIHRILELEAAVAAEREACAAMIEDLDCPLSRRGMAAAIRARGGTINVE
jgi:hypothetical protein